MDQGGSTESAISGNLEDEFHKELENLKDAGAQKFKWIPTNMDCLNICQTFDPIDPNQLVKAILGDLASTKQKKTRYTQRMLPLQKICAASMTEILETSKLLIDPVFHPKDSSSAVPIKVHKFI